MCACTVSTRDCVNTCVHMCVCHNTCRTISVFVFVHPSPFVWFCMCVCVYVCEWESESERKPVGSLPVVCSWRCAYGETETSSRAPHPLLWWKATLIEWPGTQPPFLIITAVQSLLITPKVCRAPHSPVVLQAIRASERKIRSFWQKNPLSKQQVEKGGRRQSSVAAFLVWFLYLVHDEVQMLFIIKNAEWSLFFFYFRSYFFLCFFLFFFFSKMLMVAKRCTSCFFYCCAFVVCCCRTDLFVDPL